MSRLVGVVSQTWQQMIHLGTSNRFTFPEQMRCILAPATLVNSLA